MKPNPIIIPELVASHSRYLGLLPDDPFEQMLTNNSRSLGKRVECLLGQIEDRKALQKRLRDGILQSDCDISTKLHEFDFPNCDMRLDPIVSRQRAMLGEQLEALQQEKRGSELQYWRDLSRLYLELNQVLIDFQAAKQQERFVSM